ncbi:MAG: carotenoid biosynthesis protein [Planctomycetes bacterium]|nr:carotenoid biosynthesis protein [Planctomycetota bacterium]
MNALNISRAIIGIAFSALWIGGVLSYSLFGGPPTGSEWTAPFFLALAAAMVVVLTRGWDLHWLAIAAGIGFASELVGVATGVPFGRYEYTDTLGPKLLGVPVVLTAAWLVVVSYVQSWMATLQPPRILRPLLAAAWMTVIDLLIDPLAAGPLGYWVWADGGSYYGIPWTNFLGWFVVSLVIFVVIPPSWRPRAAVRVVGASIVMFFGVIALALDSIVPGAIAAGLLLLDGISAAAGHTTRPGEGSAGRRTSGRIATGTTRGDA